MSQPVSEDEVPPITPRLSKAIAQRDWHRRSWEKTVREEISAYVGSLRDHGVPPERAVIIVKQVARPLMTRSGQFATKIVDWVATAYFTPPADK